MEATIISVLGILVSVVWPGDISPIAEAIQERPDLAAHVRVVETTLNPCSLENNQAEDGRCLWGPHCDLPGVPCIVGESRIGEGKVVVLSATIRHWPSGKLKGFVLHEMAHAYLWDACEYCTEDEVLTQACADDRTLCPPLPEGAPRRAALLRP